MSERRIFISGKRSGKTIALVDYMVKERLIAELEEIKAEIDNKPCKLDEYNKMVIDREHFLKVFDNHIEELKGE